MSRGRVALWGVPSAMLAGLLAVAAALAAGAVPKSWGWAHDGPLLWWSVASLLGLGALVAVLQARSVAEEDEQQQTVPQGPVLET